MLERSPVLDRSFRRLADDFPKGTHRKACGVGKAADLFSDNVSKLNNPFALLHLRKPDDVMFYERSDWYHLSGSLGYNDARMEAL